MIRCQPSVEMLPNTQCSPLCLRPHRATLGMRWLVLQVLLVILLGTFVSSVGVMNSHGIAAIATAAHAAPAKPDTSHDHAHAHAHQDGDSERATGSWGASSGHPEHGQDHSHDKAHALPIPWEVAAPQLPVWIGQVRLMHGMIQASRLERPPMG